MFAVNLLLGNCNTDHAQAVTLKINIDNDLYSAIVKTEIVLYVKESVSYDKWESYGNHCHSLNRDA